MNDDEVVLGDTKLGWISSDAGCIDWDGRKIDTEAMCASIVGRGDKMTVQDVQTNLELETTIKKIHYNVLTGKWKFEIKDEVLYLRDLTTNEEAQIFVPTFAYWKLDPDFNSVYVCSNCGFDIDRAAMQTNSLTGGMELDVYNFCPKCGRNMWLVEEVNRATH